MSEKRPEMNRRRTSADRGQMQRRRTPEMKAVQPSKKEEKSLVSIAAGRALANIKRKDESWEKESRSLQRVRHGFDRYMVSIIFILIALGTIMVFSASYSSALNDPKIHDAYHYIRQQLMFVGIGSVGMILASYFPYHWYKIAAPSLALVAIGLLVLVLIMGTARGVAQRWIIVGPISVQASEPAKAALILFLAYYIDRHYEIITKRTNKQKTFWQGIVAPGVIVAVFCGLVLLEKHLSGTIIIGLIGMAIIFVSGADILKMILFYGVPAGLAGGIYLLTNSYALARITTHQNENADVLGEAWQTTQGLYAIGSGGLLGLGLGESNLKNNYVSEAHNDFIFTIWCEEMGFVGAVILIALYGFFIWRGFVIAKRAPDTFSSLTAFGITFQVGIQAALNILVVTDILPNTGVSLPFFSYGGSSLIMLMLEMGVLLSISRHSYQKK